MPPRSHPTGTVPDGLGQTAPDAPDGSLSKTGSGAALLLDMDGTVRRSSGPAPFPRRADEVVILPRRRQVLGAFARAGAHLLGVSNQACIGLGQVSARAVAQAMKRTVDLLELEMDVRWCPHRPDAGCWCRKPNPGLGEDLIQEYQLDPARIIMVGDRKPDAGFAANLGVRFVHADDFFAKHGPTPADLGLEVAE